MLKTKKQAEALSNLRSNSDFAVVLDMLKEYEHAQTEKALTRHEPHALHRAQGSVEAVRDLRAAYVSAPDMINKLK